MYRKKTFRGKLLAWPTMKNLGKILLLSVRSALGVVWLGWGRFLGGVCCFFFVFLRCLFLRGWSREMMQSFSYHPWKNEGGGIVVLGGSVG